MDYQEHKAHLNDEDLHKISSQLRQHNVIMGVFAVAFVSFGIAAYFTVGDNVIMRYASLGMLVLFAGISSIYLIQSRMRLIKDRQSGEKWILKGVLDGKDIKVSSSSGKTSSRKESYYFKLKGRDEKILVESSYYHSTPLGDSLEIHFLPISQTILTLRKIKSADPQDNISNVSRTITDRGIVENENTFKAKLKEDFLSDEEILVIKNKKKEHTIYIVLALALPVIGHLLLPLFGAILALAATIPILIVQMRKTTRLNADLNLGRKNILIDQVKGKYSYNGKYTLQMLGGQKFTIPPTLNKVFENGDILEIHYAHSGQVFRMDEIKNS